MKMNLSVVMQTIDKMSAPLKKITSTQSKYSKQLAQIKEQTNKLTSNQALISQYRKTGNEAGKTGAKFNIAQQKLAKLTDKMRSAKAPSEALQLQIKKQQAVVQTLKTTQNAYVKELTKTKNKMKSAGIDVKRLSSEEQRLSKEYDKRMGQIDKLAKKEKRLQRIRAKLAKFKMPNIGGAAMGKMGAVLGGASIAGFFAAINSSAAEMDALSKSAQNLNMPVEELQAMQSQAEHAGVSADTMTGAMTRFTKRLGVLQTTGAGAMGSFLKKGKNPLYEELKTAGNTEQAYGKVLNAFSKLKTNQEQMAFADATFGQDGRKMLIMLREGTSGLTSARKEFNDLGGGVKTEDAKKAEAYNDALQKIQESIKSMKFSALAPIMEKMTVIFTEFSNKFKNAQWRTEVIEKVKNAVTGLFQAFKILGKGLLFLSQNIPEVIAGLALFKIAMFALNAAMLANPVGLVVSGIAALVVLIGYGINALGGWNVVWGAICDTMKLAWQGIKDIGQSIKLMLIPVVDGISGAFNRVSAGVNGAIGMIKSNLLTVPRAIMKMLSLIPAKLLPDGWGDSIKSAQQKLEELNKGLKVDAKANIEYALNGPSEFKEVDSKLKGVRESVEASQPGDQAQQVKATLEKLEVVREKIKEPQQSQQVNTESKETHEKLEVVREKIKESQQSRQVNTESKETHEKLEVVREKIKESQQSQQVNTDSKETHEKLEVVREKIKESQQSLQVNSESKETHEKLEVVRENIKASQQDNQINPAAQDPVSTPIAPKNDYGGMLRHPTVQSKSQVDVRIKSDKPVEIVKAESDKHTEMNVDTFDFNWSF